VRAQRWLLQTGFEPTVFATRNPFLMLATGFVPWLHSDDHPPEDVQAMRYRVATPQAIERWVIWPTLIVVGLGFAAWGVVESDPRMVISGTLSALLAVFFLRRNIKNKGANGAPEAPKGMEPTA